MNKPHRGIGRIHDNPRRNAAAEDAGRFSRFIISVLLTASGVFLAIKLALDLFPPD